VNYLFSATHLFLLTLFSFGVAMTMNSHAESSNKEPHFIIYPLYSPEATKEEKELHEQKMATLEHGAKLAFDEIGVSYEIAPPTKATPPDRFKVFIENNGENETLEINRIDGSDAYYTEKQIKEKLAEQLPEGAKILEVYKEYNVKSILNEMQNRLEEQISLRNKTRDEYYIVVADSNIFSELYSNFLFWTSIGRTSVVSQDMIIINASKEGKTGRWASEQTAKLLSSLALNRLGVKPTGIKGCLTGPVYNAQTLFKNQLNLNSNVKEQLKSILGRGLVPQKTRPPLITEGNRAITQTSYETTMSQFIGTALKNAHNDDPRMLSTLVRGSSEGLDIKTQDMLENIKRSNPDLVTLHDIIKDLDTTKGPYVVGYDSTTSPDGTIETTRILFGIPQKSNEDASITMEILRYANGLHLITKAAETINSLGFKSTSEDPQIPSR
jgi:hypothetical protein